jgi:hypothetical protein
VFGLFHAWLLLLPFLSGPILVPHPEAGFDSPVLYIGPFYISKVWWDFLDLIDSMHQFELYSSLYIFLGGLGLLLS